jgi:hypothetical protein
MFGVPLATTRTDEGALEAVLPFAALGAADDLVVAILADQQTRSASIALPSVKRRPDFILTTGEQFDAAAAEGDERPPVIAKVDADLTWNSPNQEIDFVTIGTAETPTVQLRRDGVVYPAAVNAVPLPEATVASLQAAPVGPGTPASVKAWKAVVPPGAVANFRLETIAYVLGPSQQASAAPAPNPLNQPIRIPLGGRARVHAYVDDVNNPKRLAVVQEDATGVRRIPPAAVNALKGWTELPSSACNIFANPIRPSALGVVDREDPADTVCHVLRGTGLTLEAPAKLRVVSGTLEQLFDVQVVKHQLGSKSNHLDDTFNKLADLHGVPPQYLKAQAMRESGEALTNNFRHEVLTRDFAFMTTDNPRLVNAPADPKRGLPSRRWTDTSTLAQYVVGGTRLKPRTASDLRTLVVHGPQAVDVDLYPGVPQAQRSQVRRGFTLPPAKTHFFSESDPQVAAVFCCDAGKSSVLTLFHNYEVWRKVGTNRSGAIQGYKSPVIPHSLGPDEFSVDYAAGIVTLGRPLLAGQSVTITWYDLANATEPLAQGARATFDLMQTDAKNRRITRSDVTRNYSAPTAPESLRDHFIRNLIGGTDRKWGVAFTGTYSERMLEFRVGADGFPSVPLDPRFSAVTTQPYVSSSYGLLQALPDLWEDPTFGPSLRRLFPVEGASARSFFELLRDVEAGLRLGATRHKEQYDLATTSKCTPSCTRAQWDALWDGIMLQYNPNGDGYADGEIVTNARAIEPR